MLKEYDLVRLKRSVTNVPVDMGAEGTIVMVLSSEPPAYLVEFFDSVGASIGDHLIMGPDLENITLPPE